MKGIVVYYSQTGNTKKIAHALHEGMRQVIEECDIAKLKEVSPQELIGYDLIGLGSPWWSKLPPNVTAFIDGMASLEGKHAFPFCTHGSRPSGFMQIIIPALKQKGLTIIGFNDWYGNSLQQFIPYPHLTAGHPDDIDIREAGDFGRKMAQLSQRIYQGETQLIPNLPTIDELDELYGYKPSPHPMSEAEETLLKSRKINMEKCQYPECSFCVDNCPMNSIDFSVSPPVFRKNCQMDWFCEIICPEGAIEADFEPYARVHDLPIKEVFTRFLEKEEAEGRFRRLVPAEKVGWDTHYYQITGHPRYVMQE